MTVDSRQQCLQTITFRLVSFTGTLLLVLAIWLYWMSPKQNIPEKPQEKTSVETTIAKASAEESKDKTPEEKKQKSSYLGLLVFFAGLLGGFVSIQQRLPSLSLVDLKLLSSSWTSITLMPLNGGVFALVLLLMFVGNIIQGELFPHFINGFEIKDANSYFAWIKGAYPETGVEVAKLLFWSFVAGFSERFVPQLIKKKADETEDGQQESEPKAKEEDKENLVDK